VNHKHYQTGVADPKLAEIEMGEIFVQSWRDDGIECENPHKKVHDGPQPFLLGITEANATKANQLHGFNGKSSPQLYFT
jgi:hypothetical protein